MEHSVLLFLTNYTLIFNQKDIQNILDRPKYTILGYPEVIPLSLHRPLGQLATKALNLLPKIGTKRYSVRSNQIIALISKLL